MTDVPSKRWWHLKLGAIRGVTLLAPPVAFVLVWASPLVSRREKILGSIGIPIYSILYVALLAMALDAWFGVQVYEWRGGYWPVLTLSPTLPDYDAVEANRAHQRRTAPATSPRLTTDAPSATWPGFRGANCDAHYSGPPILTRWPVTGLHMIWKQPIGGGYASFAVANGLAFTIEQRRAEEVVTAYDMATGREVWKHGWEAEFRESIGGNGPRATPTYSEGRLYALGGRGELRSLNAATGELHWRRDILRENQAEELKYGVSASPLVMDDKVIVLAGASTGRSVVAYQRLTGEVLWRTFDDQPAYVSPMHVTLAGEPQLLIVFAKRTVGASATDGRLLWEFAWGEPLLGRNVAQPVIWNGNRLLLSAGYDTGSTALEIEKTGAGLTARALWSNKSLKSKFPSSIFWQGHIYGLDEEILTCLDAATGERKWKDGRYGYGELLLASGHLIILCGNGDLALVAATPVKHMELARVPGIRGKTWNHPALAGGRLLIRNAVEMACFDVSAK